MKAKKLTKREEALGPKFRAAMEEIDRLRRERESKDRLIARLLMRAGREMARVDIAKALRGRVS